MENKELEARAEKYFNLYDTSPDMYLSIDPEDGSIKECNQTVVRKTGYTKEEIIGQPVFFLYHPGCMPRVKKAFQSFTETGRVENAALEIKTKDGSTIPVLLSVEAVRDQQGNILYSNSCWRDISQIKRWEQQWAAANKDLEKKVREQTHELEIINKELGHFAYIASHDLQEPLRTVMSFVELLRKDYHQQLDDNAQKYINYISQATEHMRNLVKGLLEYSLIGHQRRLTTVDCKAIVTEIQADLAAHITESKAIFEIGELPQLYGYETELRLLFQNLITNAIKFQKKDTAPLVKISAQQENGHWKFSFTDNGIGIEDQYTEMIFTLFQRLHLKSEYEGTGIGLAHCRKIVHLHGGQIWVDSHPNEGSTFYFTIPN